jgi:ureidoglycolate hydrolase
MNKGIDMFRNYRLSVPLALTIFVLGLTSGSVIQLTNVAEAQSSDRVFELRTYTTFPGRLDALHARFANHTIRVFERHGMTNIGYFTPQDTPLAENTLIYIIAHDSREAAEASWEAFIADPEWQRAYEESIRDGQLVEKLESTFMDPTDYSQMK